MRGKKGEEDKEWEVLGWLGKFFWGSNICLRYLSEVKEVVIWLFEGILVKELIMWMFEGILAKELVVWIFEGKC